MNLQDVKSLLINIGFMLQDGASSPIYEKVYNNLNNYKITVDLDNKDYTKSKIDYGHDIKYGRTSTQNLHQKETFVILECVNRLLENGYSPKEIILEKDYPSGRKRKGQYLDILITKEGLPYFMIECKTWGNEYDSELKNMRTDGGQLLTYYTNDRDVKALCLYTSTFNKSPKYTIIDTSDFDGSGKEDLYKNWDKQFCNIPMFEKPYGVISTGIKRDDLYSLSEDKKLYNGFARILRKYAVSDLTNAYNKLFNLFLCKIVDEDKLYSSEDYEIQFQWKKEDTSYDVLNRLSNLYNEGIKKYLQIDVTDYDKDKIIKDIEILSKGNKELSSDLLREFNELRFIKNNEFAFIEVFNMETFKQNSLILKAVVKLFEKVQIKYSDKQQFMGDFFERLLNIGIKQTEGQFFTPIPIANFIVNSIPLEHIIDKKIKNEEPNFLPYMIDYACGAGHFITEYMHRLEAIVKKKKESDFSGKLQKDNYKLWSSSPYKWAKEFVYGIEKDYRLTKTSKIACFLNGDGDANIITGNGLDSFDSEIFNNTILQENSGNNYVKDNPVFDCVIANPPYSVQDFKDTLKKSNEEPYGEKNFELFKSFGDKSDDIECLFMERTKQLVKENGFAAIVIANTFLTNGGIHQKTREMILKNFKIKGIIELGSGAFMATGTNTIVLFMQKRENGYAEKINRLIKDFKKNPKDINFNNKEKFISEFLKNTYEDIIFEDYASLFNKKINDNFKKSDLYEEYIDSIITKLEATLAKKKNDEDIQKIQKEIDDIQNGIKQVDLNNLINIETEKLYMYLLNDGINTVTISAGENKDEVSDFLGYKFSKRRGDEGLKELDNKMEQELESYSNRASIKSKLYNPEVILDTEKVNYYIYKNLLNKELDSSDLELMKKKIKKMNYSPLNDLIEYDNIEFNSNINTEIKKKIKFESSLPLIKLKNVKNIVISSGNNAPQEKKYFENGKNPFIRARNLNNVDSYSIIIPNRSSFINETAISDYKLKRYQKGTIVFPISGKSIDTNNIGILGTNAYVVNHLACVYHPNPKIRKILFEIFNDFHMSNLKSNSSDYPTIKLIKIKNFKIPNIFNDDTLLCKIVNEIKSLENNKNNLIQKLEEKENDIDKIFILSKGSKNEKLSKYLHLEYGIALPERNRVMGDFPVVGSNGIFGYHSEFMLTGPNIIVGRKGSVGKVNYIEKNCTPIDTTFYVVINKEKIFLKYGYYLLKSLNLESLNVGLGPGGVNRNKIHNQIVNVPNIDKQKDFLKKISPIENEIEQLQKEIDEIPTKKRAILEKYLK